jgi:hypothetical protein
MRVIYYVEIREPEGWVVWDEGDDYEEAQTIAALIRLRLDCPEDEVRISSHVHATGYDDLPAV